MIPAKFINKTGNYSVVINGTTVSVKLADSTAAIDQFLTEISGSSMNDVLGLDHNSNGKATRSFGLMAVCGGPSGKCLIINLDYLGDQVPESLKKYLTNPDKCFVKASALSSISHEVRYHLYQCIEASDLAARVLNKHDLYGSSVSQIAHEVGVPIEDVKGSSSHDSRTIQLEQKFPRVLTSEQVKMAVVNAYTCYKIGVKLLYSDSRICSVVNAYTCYKIGLLP